MSRPVTPDVEPLWETRREDFPVTRRLIYLNHAAVAPLCAPAAAAMKGLADDAWMYGSYHYDQWLAAYEGLRAAAARMVNAHRDEIAIVKNTSEGISTVALGLDCQAGDRVVAFAEEFPANLYPWQLLEKKGDYRLLIFRNQLTKKAHFLEITPLHEVLIEGMKTELRLTDLTEGLSANFDLGHIKNIVNQI